MIMSGMQHIQFIDRGRSFVKPLFLIVVILALLSSCATGRGDRYINLVNGYTIDIVNSREVLIVHRSPDMPGNTLVIPNYFVTAYQVHETTIFLESIKMQGDSISNEELEKHITSFFLIDSVLHQVRGPFKSLAELEDYCTLHRITLPANWNLSKTQ